MNFLPDNYVSPSSSSFYMKIQDGENRFRILTQPVFGWEDWEEKKPIRSRFENKPVKSIDPKKPVKHFWAFVVFNYAEEQIQVLHITQATIRKSIESLCHDKDWGAPYFYDIKIKKTGKDKDTEYTVSPVPHKAVDPYIISCFKERPCNLDALFINADPFANNWDKYTPLGIEMKKETVVTNKISEDQAKKLVKILSECDPKYGEKVIAALKKENVNSLYDLSEETYAKLYPAAIKNRDSYKEAQDIPFLMEAAVA